jgi:hypothetical protein
MGRRPPNRAIPIQPKESRMFLRPAYALLAAMVAASLFTLSSHAAPTANFAHLTTDRIAQDTLITKVHGWHRACIHGPARYHRHVPGWGNVECAERPYYRRHWHGHRYGHRYPHRHERPRCMIEPWLCR